MTAHGEGASSGLPCYSQRYSNVPELHFDNSEEPVSKRQRTEHWHKNEGDSAGLQSGPCVWFNTAVSTNSANPFGSFPPLRPDLNHEEPTQVWSTSSKRSLPMHCSNEPNTPARATRDAAVDPDHDVSDLVCYGMIQTLECSLSRPVSPLNSRCMPTTLLSSNKILVTGTDIVGVLDKCSADILQTLLDDDAFCLQVLLAPRLGSDISQPTARRNALSATLWLNVYGPEDLSGDIGDFFQECNLYLQDPIGCDRNVPYLNPHCMATGNKPPMTFDLQQTSDQTSNDTMGPDLLDELVTPLHLPELETPPGLRTELLPHQKQGLYFMTERERGWNLKETGADLWSKEMTKMGPQFVNNVTKARQSSSPELFRGGILADSMGLGKSLSMIALIMQDSTTFATDPLPTNRTNFDVPTTLLIVPVSLIQSWEKQFHDHVHRNYNIHIRRHHGSKRITHVHELRQCNVLITTYQTLESEWRKSANADASLLFSVYWRRIIMDEAHYVGNRSTNISKAICLLSGHCRWAVTGTPLQNRLTDLSTLCQILRVFPYDNPKRFYEDIIQEWKSGSHEVAFYRLRFLLRCILLRRAKGTIELPKRVDKVVPLQFSDEERLHYANLENRVAKNIDIALSHCTNQSQSAYLTVLQQINELRLTCNLGLHRKRANGEKTILTWNVKTAQKAFDTLTTADVLGCAQCGQSLDGSDTNALLGFELQRSSYYHQLYQCLTIVCATCVQSGFELSCGHHPPCSRAQVSQRPGSSASSPSDSGSAPGDDSSPSKITALLSDLMSLPTGTKSVVFSYWTSTLDLIEEGLIQASLKYTRFDGNTAPHSRNLSLRTFRNDSSVSVILMTISCASVGLDITAASRAYIMEPQWNPTVEEQALARIHRMGQTKEVTTIRFVMEESFEQRVIETQVKKRDLARLLLSSDRGNDSEHSLDKLRHFRSLLK